MGPLLLPEPAGCPSAGAVGAAALAATVSESPVPIEVSGAELSESEPSVVPKFDRREMPVSEAKLWLLLPPPVSPIFPPFLGDSCTL